MIIEITQNEVKIKPKQNVDEFLKKFIETPQKLNKKIDIEALLDEQYK